MKRNVEGTTVSALVVRENWYPIGPGGNSLPPGKSRVSIKEMDRRPRLIPVNTVTKENMATVWARRGHLILPILRLAGSNKATKHLQNNEMVIPRVLNRTNKVSTDKRTRRPAYRMILCR